MMDFIMVPAILAIITLGIYKLFELFARRRERMAIIEKLSEAQIGSAGKIGLPDYSTRHSFGALKGGCLLIGVGLGLLVGFVICLCTFPDYFENVNKWEHRNVMGMIYGSSVLMFGGIGLITAFLIEVKMGKKKEKNG